MPDRFCNRRWALIGLASLLANPALAQHGHITLVVPTVPGGATDAVGRMVAAAWPGVTGRAMIVDNRGGAQGTIGASFAAKAPADGTVMLLCTGGMLANPLTMKSVPVDMLKNFTYVTGLAESPLILVANINVPVRDARELKAYAAGKPDATAFAVADSSTRLGTELLLQALGLKAITVSYRGTGPSMTDVAGGHVPLAVTSVGSALSLVEGGRIKVLGVLSTSRIKLLPNVPTLAEQGFPAEYTSWWAISVPASTPKATVAELAADLQKIVRSPAFEAQLEGMSMTPFPLGPAELETFTVQSLKRWSEVALSAGIRPE